MTLTLNSLPLVAFHAASADRPARVHFHAWRSLPLGLYQCRLLSVLQLRFDLDSTAIRLTFDHKRSLRGALGGGLAPPQTSEHLHCKNVMLNVFLFFSCAAPSRGTANLNFPVICYFLS